MRLLSLTMALIWTPLLWGLDDPKEKSKPDKTPKIADKSKMLVDEVHKMTKEYQDTVSEFYQKNQEKLKNAKTDEERTKIFEQAPTPKKLVAGLLSFVDEHPKDEEAQEANIEALQAVLRFSDYDDSGRQSQEKALTVLMDRYAGSEKIDSIVPNLVYSPNPKAEQLLRTIIEKNPHNAAKGKASYSLGRYLAQRVELVRHMKVDPDHANQIEKYYGKEALESAKALDPDKLEKEAEKIFEQVLAKYADVEVRKDYVTKKPITLGDQVKGELFELRNLAIGKTAPDIENEDLDGKSFKLSDYRGKVVVIDFWGIW